MNISGNRQVAANRETMWRGIHNVEVLKSAIPYCKEAEWIAPDEIKLVLAIKTRKLSLDLPAKVQFLESNEPVHLKLELSGSMYISKFSGTAELKLSNDGDGTNIAYTADAKLPALVDKLLGNRLHDVIWKFAAKVFDGIATASSESQDTIA